MSIIPLVCRHATPGILWMAEEINTIVALLLQLKAWPLVLQNCGECLGLIFNIIALGAAPKN